MTTMSYADAICRATREAMTRDDRVIVLGQGLKDSGIWGTVPREREHQLLETPLSEDAVTGIAIGMAQAGLRPITVDIRMDFALLRMNQIVNMASKHVMWGGQLRCPLVMRMVVGRSWGQGPQHSQALHAFFMHVPGLRVVAPVTAQDAYDCMREALTLDIPTIVMEHRLLHKTMGPVDATTTTVHEHTGSDLTIVGISHAAWECHRAAEMLNGESIDMIDMVRLSPLDIDPVANSVRRTGRLLVVDNGWLACGASAEILARVAEAFPGTQMKRMGFLARPCPPTQAGEHDFYPRASTIAALAHTMLHGRPAVVTDPPATEFKGPF